MATTKKTLDSSEQAEAAIGAAQEQLWTTPIFIRREKTKKKKRKKYSRGTKGFQRMILGFASAGRRVADGFSRGANTWVRRTKRSQRKRRDGLVRDVFENASRGFRKGSKEASKAPREISKRFNTRRGWRIVRSGNLF